MGDVLRMEDYRNKKEDKELKAITDEHNEFIELLSYFVGIQEPQIDEVIIKKKGDEYLVLDSRYNNIDTQYTEEYLSGYFDFNVEYCDLLISTLINLSPKKIILDNIEDEIVSELKDIFKDRVSIK